MEHKIAVFAENSSFGGISSYCLNLCKELQKREKQVWLFIPLEDRVTNHWLIDEAQKNNLNYILLNCKNSFDFSLLKQINSKIKHIGISIVHTNGYRFDILIRIYRLLFLSSSNHIVCVHTALPPHVSSLRQKIYNSIDNWGHIFNAYTITVSDYTKSYVLKKSLVCKSKVVTIYNGLNFYTCRSIKPTEETIVTFVGRLSQEKGVNYLVNIISTYLTRYSTNVIFEICGDGPEKDKILKLVSTFPNNVVYKGYISDISAQLKRSHILIITSVVETFGLVALEAICNNAVVLATKVGGLTEVVQNGVTGILVEYGNIDLYVRKLEELVTNTDLRDALLKNSQKIVKVKFSISSSVTNYLSLVSSIAI